jgi:hypothetical protein
MLSLKEIIHADIDPNKLDPKKLAQEQDLLKKVNIIRTRWNKAMTVTSGVRTLADHLRIYKDKGITDQSKIPMKSKHLETVTEAAAVDIADAGLLLTKWLKDTPEGRQALNDADLYCEDGNSNWVHFQNKPFGSYKPGGTRWFKP